jgi:hypothetical protein
MRHGSVLAVLAAAAAVGTGGGAEAQILIGPQMRVDNGNPGSGVETTVAFMRSPTLYDGMEALAAAIDWREEVARVGFGVTFDGGLTWQEGMMRPLGNPWVTYYAVDPHAWADPLTGDIWLLATGGESGEQVNRLLALKRAPGVGAAQMPAASVLTNGDAQEHRPIMAAGPAPGNPGQRNLYILGSRFNDDLPPAGLPHNCPNTHLCLFRSEDNGITWSAPKYVRPFPYFSPSPPFPPPCQFRGNAGGLIIADREPQLGLVVAIADTSGYYAVWSHDAGETWPAFDARLSFLSDDLLPPTLPNDWPGTFRAPFNVAAALDPATGEFYVVAAGRREAGSRNVDLWLIRGHTTTGSPPIAFEASVRLELDGGAIHAEGPDQLMPSIAIDGCGGINLLYYDTRNGPRPDDYPVGLLDAYYTRITGFGSPQESIFTARLTDTFCSDCLDRCGYRPPACVYEDPSLEQFMGDYNTIDAAGCDVYVAYMSMHTGQRHYYVNRIDLCPPDSDSNLIVNAMDVATFQAFFAASDPRADFTRDGVVDVADYAAFSASFASWVP